MPQKIIIAEQERIAALLTDGRVDKLIVAQGRYQIGDVYLGTIENVLPGIDAAFVNIGASEKNGFIHVTDLGPLKLKKNSASITELLEPRQKVLVQVMKEPTGNKGPRLTGNLALPGRYLVLQPSGQGVNISRRINSETERNRLRALGVLIKPPGSGLLFRTEADGIQEELLIDDLEFLIRKWDSIQQAAEKATPPILLSRDEDFIHKILRDNSNNEVSKVVVDSKDALDRAKNFLNQDGRNSVVELHKEQPNLLEHYKINTAILNSLKPRVDLPSGGYIIIEPTEALTVIDVNSGSFTRSANSRETVLWTNCEAAVEIARQLKLRNIGGVIIIDFIDMESRRDQLQLLEYFSNAIKDDSSRPQIAQLTELGLVELTRKRQGQNVYELFGNACPNCNGLGHIVKIPLQEEVQDSGNNESLIQNDYIAKENITKPNGLEKAKVKSINNVDTSINPNEENNSEEYNEDSNIDSFNNKQKNEIVGIQMDSEQEYVYSLLGLNPILLDDSRNFQDNVIVQIIKPGEDPNAAIEGARQKISNNTIKRKRKGKGLSVKSTNRTNEDEVESAKSDDESKLLEIPIDMNIEINDDSYDSQQKSEASKTKDIQNDNEVDSDPENELDDSRRRRRRSSASI